MVDSKKLDLVVVDLKRRFAVPHVLPNHRLRYYALWKSEFMPVRVLR